MVDFASDPMLQGLLPGAGLGSPDPLMTRMGVQQSPMAMLMQTFMPLLTGNQMALTPDFLAPMNLGLQQQQHLMSVVMPQAASWQNYQQDQFMRSMANRMAAVHEAQGGSPDGMFGQLIGALQGGTAGLPPAIQAGLSMAMGPLMQSPLGAALAGQDPSSPVFTQSIMAHAHTLQQGMGPMAMADTAGRTGVMQTAFEQVSRWIESVFDADGNMVQEARGIAVNSLVGLAQRFAESIDASDISIGGIASAARAAQDAFRVTTPDEMFQVLTAYGGGARIRSMDRLGAIEDDLRRSTAIAAAHNMDPQAAAMFGASINRMASLAFGGIDPETGRSTAAVMLGSTALEDATIGMRHLGLTGAEAQRMSLRRSEDIMRSSAAQRAHMFGTMALGDAGLVAGFEEFSDALRTGDMGRANRLFESMATQQFGSMDAAMRHFASGDFQREMRVRLDAAHTDPQTAAELAVSGGLTALMQQGPAAEDPQLATARARNQLRDMRARQARALGIDIGSTLEGSEVEMQNRLIERLGDGPLAAMARQAQRDGDFNRFLRSAPMQEHRSMIGEIRAEVEGERLANAVGGADTRIFAAREMADAVTDTETRRRAQRLLDSGDVTGALGVMHAWDRNGSLAGAFGLGSVLDVEGGPLPMADAIARQEHVLRTIAGGGAPALGAPEHAAGFRESMLRREVRLGGVASSLRGSTQSFQERAVAAFDGHANATGIQERIQRISQAIASGAVSSEAGEQMLNALRNEMGPIEDMTREQRALYGEVLTAHGAMVSDDEGVRTEHLRRISDQAPRGLGHLIAEVENDDLRTSLGQHYRAIFEADGLEGQRDAMLTFFRLLEQNDQGTATRDLAPLRRAAAPMATQMAAAEGELIAHARGLVESIGDQLPAGVKSELTAAIGQGDAGSVIRQMAGLASHEVTVDGRSTTIGELDRVSTVQTRRDMQATSPLRLLGGLFPRSGAVIDAEIEAQQAIELESSDPSALADGWVQAVSRFVGELEKGVDPISALVGAVTGMELQGRPVRGEPQHHEVTINLRMEGQELIAVTQELTGPGSVSAEEE